MSLLPASAGITARKNATHRPSSTAEPPRRASSARASSSRSAWRTSNRVAISHGPSRRPTSKPTTPPRIATVSPGTTKPKKSASSTKTSTPMTISTTGAGTVRSRSSREVSTGSRDGWRSGAWDKPAPWEPGGPNGLVRRRAGPVLAGCGSARRLDPPVDGRAATVVRLLGRAGGHPHDHRQPGLDGEPVPRPGRRRVDVQLAAVVGPDVHEDVEGRADQVGVDPERGEGVAQVGEARGVRGAVELGVEHVEGRLAAGGEGEVVHPDGVVDDLRQHPAAVRPERRAGGDVDRVAE